MKHCNNCITKIKHLELLDCYPFDSDIKEIDMPEYNKNTKCKLAYVYLYKKFKKPIPQKGYCKYYNCTFNKIKLTIALNLIEYLKENIFYNKKKYYNQINKANYFKTEYYKLINTLLEK